MTIREHVLKRALADLSSNAEDTLSRLKGIERRLRDPRFRKHVASVEWSEALEPFLDAAQRADVALDDVLWVRLATEEEKQQVAFMAGLDSGDDE